MAAGRDGGLRADDIDLLEQMAGLTTGEARATHDAAIALRREVLTVVEGLVEPGMAPDEAKAVVDQHPSVLEVTQTSDAQLTQSRSMGYHLEHCL